MTIGRNTNTPSLSTQPALSGTLVGAFSLAVDKVIQGLSNRLPAMINTYDRPSNRAQVQILIPMVTTGGQVIPRAQVASVPVQIDGGGGVFISFPLVAGDLGWIEACDRDISLFLQTYTETAPNTFRKWSFSDAKFTPDVMKGFTISVEDMDSAVISTLDGTVKISMSQVGITITSPVVTINGALAPLAGITSPGGEAGSMIFQGNLQVAGSIIATGNITPSTPIP